MTYTPIAKGTTNWDVPLNAALAQLDSNITSSSSAALKAANNLSDLTNVAAARANLNLTGLANSLSNLTATTNPTVSSDSTQGYSLGSTWFNTTTNSMFVATSVAVGAAVWLQIPPTFVDLTSAQSINGNKTFQGNTAFSNAGVTTPVVVATSTSNGGTVVRAINNQSADVAYSARVTGDTFHRISVGADGKLSWGTGSGATDTNFGRATTGVAYTDKNLLIGAATALGDNGVGELQLANVTTAPTTNPTGGVVLYANAGVLDYRNPQGLIQTLAGGIPGTNTSVTVANTTTETAVATLTIPANDMVVGAAYRLKAWGVYSQPSSASPPTIRFRFMMGATQLATTGTLTLPANVAQTNKAWSIDCFMTVTSTGASGGVMGHMDFPNATSSTSASNPSTVTSVIQDGGAIVTTNTTISNSVTIAFTWGTASTSNTLTCYGVIAERVL